MAATDIETLTAIRTGLGAQGEINKTLTAILKVLKSGDSLDYDEMGKQFSDSLKQNGKSTSTSSAGVSKEKNPLMMGDEPLKAARKNLEKSLMDSGGLFSKGLDKLSDKLFNASLKDLSFGVVAGVAMDGLINNISKSTDAYKEFYSAGITFGGSMFEMNLAAADSAMSLDEFKNATMKNTQVTLALGGPRAFGGLIKQTRLAMMDVGGLGMTTSQVAEGLGEYMDTMIMFGKMDDAAKKTAAAGFVDLAKETTALSGLTGRRAEDIRKEIKQGADNINVIAELSKLPEAQARAAMASFQQSSAVFAAFGPKVSEAFIGMIGDAMGPGGAAMSTEGATMIQAGFSGLLGSVQGIADKIKKGENTTEESFKLMSDMANMGTAQMDSLEALAINDKNGPAAQMIQMFGEVKKSAAAAGVSVEQMSERMREKGKEQEKLTPLTKFFLNLKDSMELVWNAFKTGFMEGFKPILDLFGETDKNGENFSKVIGKMSEIAAKLGSAFASVITRLFGVDQETNPGSKLNSVIDSLTTLGDGIMIVVSALTTFVKGIATVSGWLHDGFTWVAELFGGAHGEEIKDANGNVTGKKNDTAGVAGGLGIATGVIGAVLLAKLVKSVFGFLFSSGAGMLNNFIGKKIPGFGKAGIGKSGGGLGGMIGGLGKGIGGLGKGIGAGIGGILTGIAEGIGAFGNIKVIKGAFSLIVLSGSIWLASKAFQNLSKVNWESVLYGGIAIAGFAAGAFALGALLDGPGAIVFASGLAGIAGLGLAMQLFPVDTVKAIGESLGGLIGAFGGLFQTIGTTVSGTFTAITDDIVKLSKEADPVKLLEIAAGMTAIGAATAILGAGSGIAAIGKSVANFVSPSSNSSVPDSNNSAKDSKDNVANDPVTILKSIDDSLKMMAGEMGEELSALKTIFASMNRNIKQLPDNMSA